METNIDDMNSEIYTYLLEKAFDKGALDVFMTPIIMKKNRPGIRITILCEEPDLNTMEQILFLETTTLGVRKYMVDRRVLERNIVSIDTKYGSIAIKVGYLEGRVIKYSPEYEDCKRMAKIHNVPIKDVYEEANIEAKKLLSHK